MSERAGRTSYPPIRLGIAAAFIGVVAFGTYVPSSGAAATDPPFVFTDVTAKTGVADALTDSYVHAGAWGDVDGDADLDLFAGTFVTGPTQVPNTLLRNHGATFVSDDGSPTGTAGRASGAALADLDGDGDNDLVVSNNRKPSATGPAAEPSRLFRNDDGTFVDVTDGSGLDAQASLGRQVGVLDHDGDGRLDLFIVADSFGGGGPTVLLHNDGQLRFSDVTAAAGVPADMHGLGLAFGDVTGDGWTDVFVAGGPSLVQPNPNYLLVANGDGKFRSVDHDLSWVPYTTGNEDWVSSGAFADVNRDGRLDLLVGHHYGSASENGPGAPIRLYLNRGTEHDGTPRFEDVTEVAGLPPIDAKAPHVDVQDFDNDGWPDLYVSVVAGPSDARGPVVLRHRGLLDGVPVFGDTDVSAPHYYPVGPVADYDRDGRLDIFLGEFRSVYQGTPKDQGSVPSVLLRNETPAGNWLRVRVDGPTGGVGAFVRIYEPGRAGDADALLGSREISVGSGFSSTSPAEAHFGVGTRTSVDVVVDAPRGGARSTVARAAVNREIEVDPDGSPRCPEAPIDARPHIVGTPGRDELRGSRKAEVICGLGGGDIMLGGGGDDLLLGGDGRDLIMGQAGDDTINGGRGSDMLIGGGGADAVDGGAGRDWCLTDRRDESPVSCP